MSSRKHIVISRDTQVVIACSVWEAQAFTVTTSTWATRLWWIWWKLGGFERVSWGWSVHPPKIWWKQPQKKTKTPVVLLILDPAFCLMRCVHWWDVYFRTREWLKDEDAQLVSRLRTPSPSWAAVRARSPSLRLWSRTLAYQWQTRRAVSRTNAQPLILNLKGGHDYARLVEL